MKQGFLYYAHNNEIINYLKLAICSALTGHCYSKHFRATVITDDESIKSLTSDELRLLEKCFERVKINNQVWKDQNKKLFQNVFENKGSQDWWNKSRPSAYQDSDYDQTVLTDVDFIFQDSNIDKVWNSNTPVMFNQSVIPLSRQQDQHHYLSNTDQMVGRFTVPMRWATLVYFDRSEFSQDFFYFVNYIKENWFAVCKIHEINSSTYRNDHAFTIALYMANGFLKPEDQYNLPFNYVLTTHHAKIHQINLGLTRFLYHTPNQKTNWGYTNIQDISYHCMNKVSMLEHFGTFVDFYGENI